MKRFLKHNRYKLSDRERENIWYTIRRELNPNARTPWFSMRPLRPALAGIATVAALAVAFLGQAANATEPETLLSYGAGIALVIAALGFFVRHVGDGQPSDDD